MEYVDIKEVESFYIPRNTFNTYHKMGYNYAVLSKYTVSYDYDVSSRMLRFSDIKDPVWRLFKTKEEAEAFREYVSMEYPMSTIDSLEPWKWGDEE